ncbi:Ger(x)C family spore germination protein [Paenibacillus glycinis]|uniref:Ger(X)C family spore germination protein n=1 Tax=Paenibacillus glycinis TaxID=2697035 RepID=A0ABW9XMC2_9BACL|nr:Ger(x)C family spore germination protein [Paenibacillus glycinis]NBD23779.1 Ger(x)C family spore germination protein [Paenibacillus glycinis]
MRLSKAFAFGLACLLMLQGCRSDYKDIDRRQFVVTMGLDKAEGEGRFRMTLRGAIPESQNQGSSSAQNLFESYETTAASIGQAVQQVTQQFFLEPDYSHLKGVIIGEKLARADSILKYVDFFIRRRDFQDLAMVAVTDNAEEIIKLQQKGERTAGDNLFMKFGEGVNTEYTPSIELQQIYKYSLTPGITFYCPILRVQGNKITSGATALFDRDNRMILRLNGEETKYFNLLRRGLDRGFIVLGPKKQAGLGIRQGSARFRLRKKQGGLLCEVFVKLEAAIEDSDQSGYTPADLKKMAETKLNADIARLLLKMQANGVDPLFIGLKYWAKNPGSRLDRDWLDELYPAMEFRVRSEVKITRSGTLRWNNNGDRRTK